jgi:hypothetical protein
LGRDAVDVAASRTLGIAGRDEPRERSTVRKTSDAVPGEAFWRSRVRGR